MANPWETFVEKYPVGTELEGEVKNITEFGLFVGLPGEIDGMVHLSDLDWQKPGEEAIKDYKKGDMVKVRVLDVDIEKERISLGIKQLAHRSASKPGLAEHQEGRRRHLHRHRGHRRRHRGDVGDGLPGFIRKAELSRDRAEQRPDRFAVGEKVDAKITGLDAAARKVDAVDQGARSRGREAGDGRIRLVGLRRLARRHPRRGFERRKGGDKDEK